MVVPSAPMARKLSADIPQLAVPADVVAAVERDPAAGVELACELVEAVRASGAFDGVHLIPVTRYREVAARLDPRRPDPSVSCRRVFRAGTPRTKHPEGTKHSGYRRAAARSQATALAPRAASA